jgi:type I restriction enzyme S subunit
MEVRPLRQRSVPAGYKQTEVGVIPDDWIVRLLPDVCRFRGGKAHEQHISDLGKFVCVNPKFISTDGTIRKYSTANFCSAKPGDILMVMSDLPNGKALAKAFLADQDDLYAVNQRVCALTPYRDSSRYLFFVLNRNRYFLRFDDGVNQTHLLNRVFQKCPLPIPPTKAEQETIAEALSDADALIESLAQLLAKKRQLKQGAMQELLTGKKRLPGFEVKLGYKQTEVGVIPEDWEVRRLDEGIKLMSGHHVLAQHCNTDGDGVAYITGPADFPNGVIRHSKYTTRPGTICSANDILVTVKGSGAGTLVLSDAPYCISRQLMAIRVHSWSTPFIYFSLLRDSSLFGAAATGLIPGLSRSDILNKVLPSPPTKTEQEAIAATLSDMDAEIAALEAKRTKARQIKQGMMQELLTGRIRLIRSSKGGNNAQC